MKGRGELGQDLLTLTATKEGSEGVRFPLKPLPIELVQSPWDGSDIQHPDFCIKCMLAGRGVGCQRVLGRKEMLDPGAIWDA